jgi:nitrate reductase assembly molybdenum cofactor insertion protein NarJ
LKRLFSKGYKSSEMLQKAMHTILKADLENAAKWYCELFNLTQDLRS